MTIETPTGNNWKDIAQAKRASVLNNIPKEWRITDPPTPTEQPNAIEYLDAVLPANEGAITSLTLLQLRDKIATGSLTAVEVTTAFCHRAALAHQLCNNLCEIFFDKALARAAELDRYLAETGSVVGPLHGLPISLKDQINLEGIDSCIGYVALVNKPKTSEEVSVIAQILEHHGAVFYVKTAVPMAMMSPCTISNLHGQTVNPHNRLYSAGGSSGGESSLIAARGSLIGLSTDIGGSIRIPAAFNGLFGLRPSTGRLPYANISNSMAYQPIVPSVVGPSAQDIDDLEFFVKCIVDSEPWKLDPKTPPIPWRKYDIPEKLVFGFVMNNGYITPDPPYFRAMQKVKEGLIKMGHEVVEWWSPPVTHHLALEKLSAIFTADGMEDILKHCEMSGEPPVKQLLGMGDPKSFVPVSVSGHWEQAREKYEHQLHWDSYLRSTASFTSTGRPVDAWISPPWESVSYKAGDVRPWCGSYTEICNYLDLSATIVPICHASKELDVLNKDSFVPLNDEDLKNSELYSADDVDGMPVTVQVIGGRYEEEKVIALAKLVYDATH